VHFFEDEYGQIEILPVENFDVCLENAKNVKMFSDNHMTEAGYTAVFSGYQKQPIVLLHDLRIDNNLFDEVLRSAAPKFVEVIWHDGSTYATSKSTIAFGYDENVVVFCDEEAGFIKTIWLRLNIKKESDIVIVF
jgi:hypothetical protein